MTRLLLLAGAACLAMVTMANAATITIGLQEAGVNGGAITNLELRLRDIHVQYR